MFNIGFPELIVILGLAILVVGPSRLPALAKSLGKGMREFRKVTDGFKDSLHSIENQPTLPPKPGGNDKGNGNSKPTES